MATDWVVVGEQAGVAAVNAGVDIVSESLLASPMPQPEHVEAVAAATAASLSSGAASGMFTPGAIIGMSALVGVVGISTGAIIVRWYRHQAAASTPQSTTRTKEFGTLAPASTPDAATLGVRSEWMTYSSIAASPKESLVKTPAALPHEAPLVSAAAISAAAASSVPAQDLQLTPPPQRPLSMPSAPTPTLLAPFPSAAQQKSSASWVVPGATLAAFGLSLLLMRGPVGRLRPTAAYLPQQAPKMVHAVEQRPLCFGSVRSTAIPKALAGPVPVGLATPIQTALSLSLLSSPVPIPLSISDVSSQSKQMFDGGSLAMERKQKVGSPCSTPTAASLAEVMAADPIFGVSHVSPATFSEPLLAPSFPELTFAQHNLWLVIATDPIFESSPLLPVSACLSIQPSKHLGCEDLTTAFLAKVIEEDPVFDVPLAVPNALAAPLPVSLATPMSTAVSVSNSLSSAPSMPSSVGSP